MFIPSFEAKEEEKKRKEEHTHISIGEKYLLLIGMITTLRRRAGESRLMEGEIREFDEPLFFNWFDN